MTKLPGMSLLCVLIAAVFAFTSITPPDLVARAKRSVVKRASNKKSKRSRKRPRSSGSVCTTASRAAGKQQAFALLSANSPELCKLTGVQYAASNDSITSTSRYIAGDSEITLDQQDIGQQEEGEILSELEQEDDITPDLEAFRSLWLSMVSEREKDDATVPGSMPKQQLADIIMDWLGTRYHYGGTSRSGIDCSAYMQVLFTGAFNYTLPRTSLAQSQIGKTVGRRSDLQFGDLVFFATRSGRTVSHVGMYLGDNLFTHSSSRYGVTISSLESTYYSKRLVAARRLDSQELRRVAANAPSFRAN